MTAPRGLSTFRHAAAVVTLAIAGLGMWTVATAATPVETAITTRQANFKQMGVAMKAILDQLRSDSPDRAVLTDSARKVAAIAPGQVLLFPVGSGPESGIKTAALPAIWADSATFNATGKKLAVEAKTLAGMTATGDLAALQAQAKVVSGQCATCHRQFRMMQ